MAAGFLLGAVSIDVATAEEFTLEGAARRALALFAAKDEAGLASLAKSLVAEDEPGVWIAVDELCRRRAFDAAAALAGAAKGPDVGKLPAYVDALRTNEDAAMREKVTALGAAFGARDIAKGLAITAALPPADTVVLIRLRTGRGLLLRRIHRHGESMAAFLEAAKGAEKLGWVRRAQLAYRECGQSAALGSDWASALAHWSASIRIAKLRGDKKGEATALADTGIVFYRMGQPGRAITTLEAALAIQRSLNNERQVAHALGTIGGLLLAVGRRVEARPRLEEALALQRKVGDRAAEALTVGNLANLYVGLGDHIRARDMYERALAQARNLGDQRTVAALLTNLSHAYMKLGEIAKAIATVEEARTKAMAAGDRTVAAQALERAGRLHLALGDPEKALGLFERAMAEHKALGEPQDATLALFGSGVAHYRMGNPRKALPIYEQALAYFESVGDENGIANALENIATTRSHLGEPEEALAIMRKVVASGRATPALMRAMGSAYLQLKDLENATKAFEAGLEMVADQARAPARIDILWDLCGIQLTQGKFAEGARLARRGVELTARLAEGLAETEGARLRDTFANLYAAGLHASFMAKDMAGFAWFLEQGRAGSLRESLGARAGLEAAVVPAALRAALHDARARSDEAVRHLRAAAKRRDLKKMRAARTALATAEAGVDEAARRIERNAKAAAAVLMGVVDDLPTIQSYLAVDEAYVAYAFTPTDTYALVARKSKARMLKLAPHDAVAAATDALLTGENFIAEAAVAPLRKLVVDSLGLGPDVRRVLVSPMGRLGYVPFALLLPDREVVSMPSGTTLGLIRSEGAKRGGGVLALGDPDYGTGPSSVRRRQRGGGKSLRLAPLAATRGEVEAVGTVKLFGRDATESGLQAQIAKQPRWRALHFACHGLVDAERPRFSSLALTADDQSDGFLTGLEIFAMRVPADLVVMSACSTSKGKIYKTEGILGLTRAFMHAGAPRVLCSLWNVDDEATRALMIKFYELWNPAKGKPLSASAALKQAQAHVRGHEKWKHPYYWAAWVLWGLPG